MLSLTQPSTSASPPASTDPLDHAVEELLVERRRDRAEVADEAGGAGEVPRLAGDEIVLIRGEHPQQAVDAIEAGRLDVLLPVPANRLTALAAQIRRSENSYATTACHGETRGLQRCRTMPDWCAEGRRAVVEQRTTGLRKLLVTDSTVVFANRIGSWLVVGCSSREHRVRRR